jgi:hypothetical protein
MLSPTTEKKTEEDLSWGLTKHAQSHLALRGSFPARDPPAPLVTPTFFATHTGIGGACSPTARKRAE